MVIVTVKIPFRKKLVTATLRAGKNVYCEWPLGNGLQEAIELRDLAVNQKVYEISGFQSQSVPAIN